MGDLRGGCLGQRSLRARRGAARKGRGALGADLRDGQPGRDAHVLRSRRPRGRRGRLARDDVGGDGDGGDRAARAAHPVGCRRADGSRCRLRARPGRGCSAPDPREHAHPRRRHDALRFADPGPRRRGEEVSGARPSRRRPARECVGRARRAPRRPRRPGQLDRLLAQQGALRPHGSGARGKRAGRRACATDAHAPRRRERPPGGNPRGSRSRRARHDGGRHRRRPPAGP